MYKFKKGDLVRIRDDIGTIEREPPGINAEMRQMGGKVCTIRATMYGGYTLSEAHYIWIDKWLEPYEEEPDIEVPNIADIL